MKLTQWMNGGPVGKHITPDDVQIIMAATAAQVIDVTSVADIQRLAQEGDLFVTAGLLKDALDGKAVPITTKTRPVKGEFTRSNECLEFVAGTGGYVVDDYDWKWLPPSGVVLTEDEVYALLCNAQPGFDRVRVLRYRSSGSAVVIDGIAQDKGGRHFIWLMKDLGDRERYVETLLGRLALIGGMWGAVSDSGAFLRKGIIDDAALRLTQPTFICGPTFDPALTNYSSDPQFTIIGGDVAAYDTNVVVLTAEERERIEAFWAEEEERLAPVMTVKRDAWLAAYVAKLIARGVDPAKARILAVSMLDGGVLGGECVITLVKGKKRQDVTVSEILADLDKYDGALTLDPVEPDYDGGRVVGKLLLRRKVPALSSFAHGGKIYTLRASARALDDNEIVDIEEFPETYATLDRKGNPKVVARDHWRNIAFLLNRWGFTFEYCEIRKRLIWSHPLMDSSGDMADEALYATLLSICDKQGLKTQRLRAHLVKCLTMNYTNFVRAGLEALPKWDRVKRFRMLAEALECDNDLDAVELALRKWFIQCCAAGDRAARAIAADPSVESVFEYVLLLISTQGGHKTKGMRLLLPSALRHQPGAYKSGAILALSVKDTIIEAIANWIVELGEAEQSFSRTSNDAMKGFLSQSTDAVRLPYATTASRFPRSSVFFGTVNTSRPLKDATGNRRFWPLRMTRDLADALVGFNVNQLWAEARAAYVGGERWWPGTDAEEALLKGLADEAHARPAIEEKLLDAFHWDQPIITRTRMTPMKVLAQINGRHSGTPGDRADFELHDLADAIARLHARAAEALGEPVLVGHRFRSRPKGKSKIYERTGKNRGYLMPAPKFYYGDDGRRRLLEYPERDLLGPE